MIRSQAGPGASAALTALPTGRETTIPFRVALLRRLRQPLPLSERRVAEDSPSRAPLRSSAGKRKGVLFISDKVSQSWTHKPPSLPSMAWARST